MGTRKEKPDADDPENEISETLNLKHDLDLQRLLKESHLLEQAKASSVLGSHRHKVTDMRMRSLGSRSSIYSQQKMPMVHRKGIAVKGEARQTLRRREAKENGIVLERLVNPVQAPVKRDRGVDSPIGKFGGGTLKLSKRDVASIQGPQRPAGRKGARRR